MPHAPAAAAAPTAVFASSSCAAAAWELQVTGGCSKIAEAEAAVSVSEKKWLVMHMHVQLKLDELRGAPNPWLTVTLKVPGQLLPFR
jgi:hypothetical protein